MRILFCQDPIPQEAVVLFLAILVNADSVPLVAADRGQDTVVVLDDNIGVVAKDW